MSEERVSYADDDTLTVGRLFRMRFPVLLVGFVLGLGLSFLLSRFEAVLSTNVELIFFIPFIVYMAAAIGGQTQSIYIRDLRTGKANFKKYFLKETLLGFVFALFASVIIGVITLFWLGSASVAWAVSLGMFGAVLVAPLVGLLVVEIFTLEHVDPAVDAGPIATVIQDALSVVIFGLIASAVLL